jgi:hypothetical protein
MPRDPRSTNDDLDDSQLLERESDERHEFFRLRRAEPHVRDTTYRVVTASRELVGAWERWTGTSLAVRVRGLLPRAPG